MMKTYLQYRDRFKRQPMCIAAKEDIAGAGDEPTPRRGHTHTFVYKTHIQSHVPAETFFMAPSGEPPSLSSKGIPMTDCFPLLDCWPSPECCVGQDISRYQYNKWTPLQAAVVLLYTALHST